MAEKQHVLNYMKWRNSATLISAILVVLSILSVGFKGINWGLDFTGGVLLDLKFNKNINITELRENLTEIGYKDSVVQQTGNNNDVLIRIHSLDASIGKTVTEKLRELQKTNIDINKIEYIGPQVGESLKEQGGLGMLLALALITLYVAF